MLRANHHGFTSEDSSYAPRPPTEQRISNPETFVLSPLVPSFTNPFEVLARTGPGMPQGRGRPILRPNMSRRGTQSDDGFCSSPERANTSSSCSSRPTSPLSSWMAEGAPGDFRRGNRLRQNTRSSSDSDEEDTGMQLCAVHTRSIFNQSINRN